MTKYEATARQWMGGWELHIKDEGVTQVRTLDRAVDQVRDYLSTLHDADFSDAEVEVIPDLDGLEHEVMETRQEIKIAIRAQLAAAGRSRYVVKKLRARGLSVTDTAAVLGVSRGRVSQLAASGQVINKEEDSMAKGDIETYHDDGQWKNRAQGNQRASSTHDTKAEAQKAGRDMARDRGVEHVIKNKDGRIGEKNTYPRSRDPRSSKG